MPFRELTPDEKHRCLVIDDLLKTRGIPVTHVATVAGISKRWLIYIRQGRVAPSFDACRKIAGAFGVPTGLITCEAFRPEVMAALEAETPLKQAV